jgi:hypothetical protein
MKLIRCFVFGCVLCALSCNRSSNDHANLNWDGSNQIESITWKVDGEKIGLGIAGYAAVLSRLEALDKGSVVTISYPSALWNEGVDNYILHDILPFASHDDLRKQFQQLMLRKDIGIKHKPY